MDELSDGVTRGADEVHAEAEHAAQVADKLNTRRLSCVICLLLSSLTTLVTLHFVG